jgi:hypothetical protein
MKKIHSTQRFTSTHTSNSLLINKVLIFNDVPSDQETQNITIEIH